LQVFVIPHCDPPLISCWFKLKANSYQLKAGY
jgi:hypothetical protein